MLSRVAEGVLVHVSDFMQSNAVVVEGSAGVLVIDPGIRDDEIASIVTDLRARELNVAAGFSTHPHWDHLLWHADLGDVPRYATATCASTVVARLSGDDWKSLVSSMIPADIVGQVSLDDRFAKITGLPADEVRVPWNGPDIRIIEHRAHAPGHAALLVAEPRVLVAGDMLSDIFVPMLNMFAPDPVADYLAALGLLEGVADSVDVIVPGHGSVGDADDLRSRIDQDRAYLDALRGGRVADDDRLGAGAPFGSEMTGITERQLERLTHGS